MAKKSKNLKKNDSVLFAFIATFFTIIGFIIALILYKEDKYVMFYAKQGLVLFIGFLIAGVLMWVPLVGVLYWILLLIIWVMAWINALSGKMRNTFIVADLAEKIRL